MLPSVHGGSLLGRAGLGGNPAQFYEEYGAWNSRICVQVSVS